KRNIKRFPDDFMFQLNENELNLMVSQNATPSKKYFGGALPYVFTENGIAMLSSILRSEISINVNIQIMRTFTRLKNQSVPYFDIIKRLEALETDNKDTKELLNKVVQVVSSMQEIQNEAKENTRKIGFRPIK
ncbi:MAG: ORF6N domain-containing protein, partial [Epsilonproteobacteria bacterium]